MTWKNPEQILRLKIQGEFKGNVCQYCTHWNSNNVYPWCHRYLTSADAPGMNQDRRPYICHDFESEHK